MRALAACPNVQVKLSGFGMLDHHWTEDSLRPLVYEAIDAFGSARCMFASNFPVCSLYTSYRRLWQAYDNLLAQAAAHERRAMFADNAWRFYQLGD
jgi:predicted TIM-barrel fold metal-dependent hydrolase